MATANRAVVVDGFGPGATMTVLVKLSPKFRARIWVATKGFAFLAWMLGVALNLEDGTCE